MNIALFDYKVTSNNPIGGCHWRMIKALSGEHKFTVFSAQFEGPIPDNVEWVRVRVPQRPLALLYVAFHLAAPVYYFMHRLGRRTKFSTVQFVETNLTFGDIVYTHFCHRVYLDRHWKGSLPRGLHRSLRWLDHRLHALLEARTYRRVKRIVVPSAGLARELSKEYPVTASKIAMLPNPIDVDRLRRPQDFDRAAFRRLHGIPEDATLLVFSALGHFERKGLPVLLGAMQELADPSLALVVIGGTTSAIRDTRIVTERLGIASQVFFVGMQRDVRPFLWASDAFAFPTRYETFSLVTYEAAAARLPLIVTLTNGIEDLVREGENGLIVESTSASIAIALRRFMAMSNEERQALGLRAEAAAQEYSSTRFVERWRDLYKGEMLGEQPA